jgi:hypothetical protein
MNTFHKSLALLGLAGLLLAAPACAQPSALPVDNVTGVIQNWRPDQHLYVKGDIGVGHRQLDGLEQWLDEHGPHWTVFLMHDAEGEYHESADGRSFRGMDAVEVALGQGLSNQTDFGRLTEPRTGEADGAVFALFLTERKFSYFGSEAQDRRGLGESNWIGGLDRDAIQAMRTGGRILDAVKDTVRSINGKLDAKIRQELADQEQVRLQRRKLLTDLHNELAMARQNLQTLTAAAANLTQRLPHASGDLAKPPLDEWSRRLSKLSEGIDDATSGDKLREVRGLSRDLENFSHAYADHELVEQIIQPLEKRIASLSDSPSAVAQPMINESQKLIADARAAHANGDRAFAPLLNNAAAALDRADQAVQVEYDRIKRAAQRRRVIRNTALATTGGLGAIVSVVLVVLNRRRAPIRANAEATFAERKKTLRSEMDRVFRLFERSGEILGSREQLAKRGYTGETQRLSLETLDNVDDLFIMSNEVERVMEEARQLIHPRDPLAKLGNMFSGTRYERGVHRITGEPLKFEHDRGLPRALEEVDEDLERTPVVTMTFEEVFKAFNERSRKTDEMLDTIETSLLEVGDRLTELAARIDEATERENELSHQAEADGLFHVPAFFDKLLPSAQRDYDEADKLAATDPVRVIQHFLPSGHRKLAESIQVAASLAKGREEVFPQLNAHAPQLKELGYATSWMQEAVGQLGDRADKLFAEAVEHSVVEDARQLAAEVVGLGDRARQCHELALNFRDELAQAIETLAGHIRSARQSIGDRLQLDPSATLSESHAHPDGHLAAARDQLAAGQAALQRGGVSAAEEAKTALMCDIQLGQSIVDTTLQVLHQFDDDARRQGEEFADAESQFASVDETTQRLGREYAASALYFRAGDPAYPAEQANTASHVADAGTLLEESQRQMAEANELFQRGQLLDAASLLRSARQSVQYVQNRYEDIQRHASRLDSQTRENVAALKEVSQLTFELRSQVDDHRATRATLSEYGALVRQVEQASQEISVGRSRDPFRNAAELNEIRQQYEAIDSMLIADRNAHAEAERAVAGMENEWRSALNLVDQARTDRIPDSSTTVQCIQNIRGFQAEVQVLRGRLNAPHDDWRDVHEGAANRQARINVEAARLRDDLQLARQSVEAFESASSEVFAATRWTGRYGIRVHGSPGADELERARRMLNSGDYGSMIQLARAAAMAAQYAMQAAQREVQRRQREEARQAEAARRAAAERRRRASPSIDSGGWGGSGGIGFPSISGGSSSSGSGGASGSGFSRSGW